MVIRIINKAVLFLFILLFITIPANTQQSKHNLSASMGLSLPYTPKVYSSVALNPSVEYFLMINMKNGFAFQFDKVEFRNNKRGLQQQITSLRLGFRHMFTERFYSQLSIGGSQLGQSVISDYAASGELRTGFLFLIGDNYYADLSGFVSQTTKEFGWIGLKLGLMYSFKKKKKKES